MVHYGKLRLTELSIAVLVTVFVDGLSVAQTPSKDPFEVADISFLIPPSERSIRIAGSPGGQPILSKTLFEQFEDFIKRGHPDVADPYTELVVTGFRFDACGPLFPPDWNIKKCIFPNIRLIAQVYDKGAATNAALHMVFALGPTTADRVARELLQMKAGNAANGISTKGVPLSIHPAFNEANRSSARTREFERELEQLVRGLAVEERFFATAVMFTVHPSALPNPADRGVRERWVWQKATIGRHAGQIELDFGGIPGFEPDRKEQTLTANLNSRGGVEVLPPSTIENGGIPNSAISAILKENREFDWGHVQMAIDVTDTMDDPMRVTDASEDCVSCHVSSTARSYLLQDRRVNWIKRNNQFRFHAIDPELASSPNSDDAIWQITGGYRVMMFGFFKGRPSISQRVINETLLAAHLLNVNSQ